MAIVSGGFEFSVVLVDSGGNKAVRSYDLTSADNAEALTDAAAIVALLDTLTNATVQSYRVSEKFVEDAFAYPVGGVNVEELALITARVDGSPDKTFNFSIPAPVDGMFVAVTGASRNIVDTADLDLIAYASIYNPGSRATISDGESIELPLLSGKRIHRGSRRG